MKRLFQIPDTLDRQDRRVRQILSVYLWILLLSDIVFGLVQFIPPVNFEDVSLPILVSIVFGAVLVLMLRFTASGAVPTNLIGLAFIVLLVVSIAASDAPEHMVDGRSSMTWVIPVIISAAILPWWGVYAAAFMSGLAIVILGYTMLGLEYPNPFSLFTLLILAFLTWVIAAIQNRSIRDTQRESANRQAVLESMSEGVVVYGADNGDLKIFSLNRAGEAMTTDETLAGIVSANEDRYFASDGRVFSVSRSPVDGVGTVAVFRDESRRVEIEKAKDSMLATVSHELRTPLASISGYSEMLRDMLDDPRMSDMAARIFSNASRLRALVSDLLDRAQIEAGSIRIQAVPYSIQTICDEVDSVMHALADDKQISLEFLCQDVPDQIIGDSGRIHQVLVNLVGNAIKFTDEGHVNVKTFVSGNNLVIQVSDTGSGITPARLPDIFLPFRRGSDYAVRKHQGAGLGLSISKQLVELMGGEISVQSEVGRGTVFQVRLPLSNGQEEKSK